MSSYNYDSIVSRHEAEALKEMIFKRARERAEALDKEVKTSYTSDIQNDVMDLARDSFVSSKNPFSSVVEAKEPSKTETENKKEEEIGFPQKKIDEVKSRIVYRNKTVNDEIVGGEREANMAEARADFAKKESFMGALNFLNSQASIVLVKSTGKTFNAMA